MPILRASSGMPEMRLVRARSASRKFRFFDTDSAAESGPTEQRSRAATVRERGTLSDDVPRSLTVAARVRLQRSRAATVRERGTLPDQVPAPLRSRLVFVFGVHEPRP
jgi:hypothetical protein